MVSMPYSALALSFAAVRTSTLASGRAKPNASCAQRQPATTTAPAARTSVHSHFRPIRCPPQMASRTSTATAMTCTEPTTRGAPKSISSKYRKNNLNCYKAASNEHDTTPTTSNHVTAPQHTSGRGNILTNRSDAGLEYGSPHTGEHTHSSARSVNKLKLHKHA